MGCGLLTIRVCLHSGWTQKRLPSVDNDDFETIPSSGEESSNSSEEEGHHKHVGSIQFASTIQRNDPSAKPARSISGPGKKGSC